MPVTQRDGRWLLAPGVLVRPEAVQFHAVRSGGPGGQHVNTTSSAVELRVPVFAITGLDAGARERLARLAGSRLTQEGELILVADTSRHQAQNRSEVLERLEKLVRRAVIPPRPRTKTRPTRGSVRRRLESKQRTSARKSRRGSVDPEE